MDSWLGEARRSTGRTSRTVNAFAELSLWMQDGGIGVGDHDENVIDRYVQAEQWRSVTKNPAAAQYLPVVKRFVARRVFWS
jgi:hypothetical protein